MFTKSYIKFLKELEENNSTEWFNKNKSRYETDVKEPFENFISNLIIEIQKLTPEIQIAPKDAIFRINRDIRFSNDKSPYKNDMSAVISRLGKKSNPCPGLYINIGTQKVVVASGLKMLNKEELTDVRHHIAENTKQLKSLLSDKKFKKYFSNIEGEKVKRVPEEFKTVAEHEPLIYNTSFLLTTELNIKEILSPNFTDEIKNIYKVTLPIAEFLNASFH